MRFADLLAQAAARPRRLLLVDAAGALLSAVLLGLVLPQTSALWGMPRAALYFLALWPCLFLLYDLGVWRRRGPVRPWHVRLIAGANLGYCLLSMGLLWQHAASLTVLGWAYFGGELLLVIGLAWVEWRVAGRVKPVI